MESEIRRTFLIAVIFNLSKNLKVLEMKKIKKIKKNGTNAALLIKFIYRTCFTVIVKMQNICNLIG